MIIERVTITGADNFTNIQDMVDISNEFPIVEWAILVSKKAEGSSRFPGRKWIDEFSDIVSNNSNKVKRLKVSTHICGRWVQEILNGTINWAELPSCLKISDRFQINTHAELHTSSLKMMRKLHELDKDVIFQLDGINDHLAFAVKEFGINVSGLFDGSHGAGVLPKSWPEPCDLSWCGYAGGLGPDNVVAELDKISDVLGYSWNTRIWIDMETKIRTESGAMLDMSKVRDVLTKVSAWQDQHDETLEPPF